MTSVLEQRFIEFGKIARSGRMHRVAYALSLAHGVYQALCCGYDQITAIELGVASGRGLRDLDQIARYLQNEFGVAIDVVGFDTGNGLPPLLDYRDHPEIWQQGDYSMDNDSVIPPGSQLILGDVANTITDFVKEFSGVVGFVAIDLDLYSSTRSAWPLFEMSSSCYLPAMPVYVDDINTQITYNPWCGEALALNEFNEQHQLRKFEEKNNQWNISNFHVFHVLDHPVRTGVEKPLYPLSISPF